MARRRLSIREATVIAVAFIGILFVLFSWSAGSYFRQAALESQTKSLSRIIEVSSNHALHEIQKHAINLHATLNENNNLNRAYAAYRQGKPSTLVALLDDPLVNGFSGATDVDLIKLRIFSRDMQYLTESVHGLEGLPHKLAAFLKSRAESRKGVDRLKATGGLWNSPKGPLYSMLLPIGGLGLEGYIEFIFDPKFTLAQVSEMASMPLSISLPEETIPTPLSSAGQGNLLPIEYLLHGDDGLPAYRLTGLEDVAQLNLDMRNNQLKTTVAFISTTFIILLLVLLMLDRAIFGPLKRILQGIGYYRNGKLDSRIRPSGLRELFTLGETFNSMIEQLQDDIKELERHSQSDGLTGLGNRRYFEQRLQEEWARSARRQHPVSILFIDIDHFKGYNDHYGHIQGDDCLRRVAEAIRQAVKRDSDVTARYGGEEFVIMLPDTDLSGARQVAEELLQAIRNLHIEHLGSNVKPFVTLSIGISCRVASASEEPETLISAADTALYQAKESGRNRLDIAASA